MRGKCLFLVIMIIYLDITNIEMTIAASIFDYVDTFVKLRRGSGSVQTGVGFSPPRSVNLPFCHLGLLKGRFSSL